MVHDVDHGQAAFQTVAAATLVGSYGNFSFDALSGQWSYTLDQAKADPLASADVQHDTLTVRSLDGAATQTVDVTIQGSNDTATITGTASGSVVEAGGVNNAIAGTPTSTGSLMVHDVDHGQAAFQTVAAATLVGSYGNFSFDALSGQWSYTLDQAKADPLASADVQHDTLTVRSLDGTAMRTIDVAIQGSDDIQGNTQATITGSATGSVVEAGGVNNATAGAPLATGRLTVHDPDTNQSAFQTVAVAALAGGYGNFSFNASSGQWSYTLDQAKADALAAGDPRHDRLTVTSLDGTAVQTIDVTIAGSNDAPVLQNVSGGNQSFDETAGLALSGTMAFTDVDLSDAHTVVSVEALGSGYIGDATANIALDSTGSGHGTVNLS